MTSPPNPSKRPPEGQQPDGDGATALPVASQEQQQRADEAILCETNPDAKQ